METTQNLSPSLIIFVFFSLVLSIWAIIDIFRSTFSRLNKVIWLLVVLFAPFGVFIYIFIGRRYRPVPDGRPREEIPEAGAAPDQGQAVQRKGQAGGWPAPLVLLALAVFCVLLYLRVVSVLGQEKTAYLLLGAIVVVGAVLTFFYMGKSKKRQ